MRGSIAIFLLIFSITVLADKPEWAGMGKATDEQKATHRAAMEAKTDDMDADESREKAEKKMKKAKSGQAKSMDDDGGDMPGKAKMGKGSEMGQEKRQEHSKKWWRFWED